MILQIVLHSFVLCGGDLRGFVASKYCRDFTHFECRCKLKDKYEEWFHHENFTHYKYIEMNIQTVGLSIVR